MTACQLPLSLFTRATKIRSIIIFYLLRLYSLVLMFQLHVFVPRLASCFSVVLTIIAVSFHWDGLSQVAKFLPLTIASSSEHEVANQKSFTNFRVHSVIRLVQPRTVKLFHTGMPVREFLHCDACSNYWRHEMSENWLHDGDSFLITRLEAFLGPLSLLSNRVYFPAEG